MVMVRISQSALAVARGADDLASTFEIAGCTVERVAGWGVDWLEPLVVIDGMAFGPAKPSDVRTILAGTSQKAIGPIGRCQAGSPAFFPRDAAIDGAGAASYQTGA